MNRDDEEGEKEGELATKVVTVYLDGVAAMAAMISTAWHRFGPFE